MLEDEKCRTLMGELPLNRLLTETDGRSHRRWPTIKPTDVIDVVIRLASLKKFVAKDGQSDQAKFETTARRLSRSALDLGPERIIASFRMIKGPNKQAYAWWWLARPTWRKWALKSLGDFGRARPLRSGMRPCRTLTKSAALSEAEATEQRAPRRLVCKDSMLLREGGQLLKVLGRSRALQRAGVLVLLSHKLHTASEPRIVRAMLETVIAIFQARPPALAEWSE